MYTPMDGRIWVNWPTIGGLCWWAGDHFEPATPEERQRLDGLNHLKGPVAYRNEAGWSADGVWAGYSPAINVGHEFELRVVSGVSMGDGSISVEMRKQCGEPKTMFSIDSAAGRVSRNAVLARIPRPDAIIATIRSNKTGSFDAYDTLGERAALNAREERRSPETRVRTETVAPRIVFELRFTADHIRMVFLRKSTRFYPGGGAMASAALLVGDGGIRGRCRP
jgi:hypothetical protein